MRAPQIYKERKHLAFTLADAKSVVARLEAVLGCAAHAAAGLAYLVIFQVCTTARASTARGDGGSGRSGVRKRKRGTLHAERRARILNGDGNFGLPQ